QNAVDADAVCTAQIVEHELAMLVADLGVIARDPLIVYDDVVGEVTPNVDHRLSELERLAARGPIEREPGGRWRLSPRCLCVLPRQLARLLGRERLSRVWAVSCGLAGQRARIHRLCLDARLSSDHPLIEVKA